MAASSSGEHGSLAAMGESFAYTYGPGSMGQSMASQPSMWGQQLPGSWLPATTEYVINACGRDFPKMDGMFRKADPFLMVWAPGAGGGARRLLFKSEVVKQNLNPQWKQFTLSAADAGGESVPLVWEAWDWDEDGSNDYIGEFTATLEQVNSQPKFTFMNPDRKGVFGRKKKATVGEFHLLSVRKQQGQAKRVPAKIRLALRGQKLAVKDLRTSDPYLVIWGQPLPSASGLPEDRTPAAAAPAAAAAAAQRRYVVIAKTEVVESNLNPTWQPLEIALELTGGMDAKLRIECFDYDDDGSHDFMGACITSLRELIQPDPQIPLIEPERKGGIGYSNSGYLRVDRFEEIPLPDQPEPPTLAYDFDVACHKLARMDLNGKSDPFVQISTRLGAGGRVVVYKSEVVYKTLACSFKRFQLSVVDCGGMDNLLNFEVYDKDPKGQELIGGFPTTLRELTMLRNNRHFLKNPKHMSSFSGIVTVNACTPSAVVEQKGVLAPRYRLRCAATGITRAHSCFTVFAGKASGAPLHRSNTVAGKNPIYDEVVLDTNKLGGIDAPIIFEFSNPNETGVKSSFIGACQTSLRELNMWKTAPTIPIINPKRLKKMPGYKASGDFQIQLFEPVFDATDHQPAAPPAATAAWPSTAPPPWATAGPAGWGGPPPPWAGGPSGWGGPPPPWAGGPSGWGAPPPWAGGPSGWGAPPPWAAGQSGWGAPPPWAGGQPPSQAERPEKEGGASDQPAGPPPGWGQAPPPGQHGAPPAGWGQGPPPSWGQPPGWGQGPPPSWGQGPPPAAGEHGASAPPAEKGQGPPPGTSGWGQGPPPGASGWGQGPPPGASGWGQGPPPGWGQPPAGQGPPAGEHGPPPGWGQGPPPGWGQPPAGYGGYGGYGAPPAGKDGGPPDSVGHK